MTQDTYRDRTKLGLAHMNGRSLAGATLAFALAMGTLSFAQSARAGEADALRDAYAIRAKECAERVPAGLWVHGCGGTIATPRVTPNPSAAALPARLKPVRRPAGQ